MAGTNNIVGYREKNIDRIREAGGVTQFNQADAQSWYHIINGLIIQGGLHAGGPGAVVYQASFPKQVLGVFMNGATASAVTLNGFTASANGYWFAIGV
jgi:hypothetical protein